MMYNVVWNGIIDGWSVFPPSFGSFALFDAATLCAPSTRNYRAVVGIGVELHPVLMGLQEHAGRHALVDLTPKTEA